MDWLETLIVVLHVLVAVALVGLVLIQQGKGADAGAAFGGGASQTVFGSQGSGSFLTKLTTALAFLFFVTSFSLAVFAKQRAEAVSSQGIPEEVPAAQQVPAEQQGQDAAPPLEGEGDGQSSPESRPGEDVPELE